MLKRWLTPDPAGFTDSMDLYQFLLNNPYLYKDADGRSVWTIPLFTLGVASGPAGWLILGATIAATAWVGYELYYDTTVRSVVTNTWETANGLVGVYLAREKDEAIDVYAPDRPLPTTEDGVPIPDADTPHTQLGTKGSKRRPGEKYPQAREFDKNGKPVKTIDFTDHGEPLIHPNPHEHPYEPNPTGGTPQRGNPQPLKNWKY